MILEKIGARIWIARIMITWGILAAATAFVKDATSFSIVRFLLGVAEAGFFPGIILYFTYWFPSNHHARIVAGFLVGLPVAVAFGAPISTALLGLDGLRYAGHPSHFSVDDALAWIDRFKPKRAVITNMHSDLDYEVLRQRLPGGVVPAYDGMKLAAE